MSTWKDNPRNYTKQYEKAIFPSLVFEECNKWWIPAETKVEDASEGMKSCLNNWYNKHTSAFDLFMDVNYFKETKRDILDYFDLDSYTEMETEIPHDMYNRYNVHHRFNPDQENQKKFMKDVSSNYGGLRDQAL